MKKISLIRILLLAFVLIAATACSEDPDVVTGMQSDISTALVGDWYTEDEALGLYGEHTYTADNIVSVNEYRKMYGYRRQHMSGSYEVKESSLSRTLTSDAGLPTTETVTVDSLSPLYFRTVSTDYGVAKFYRIVGTLDIQAGSTIQLDVLQYIVPFTNKVQEIYGYTVKDSSVASIEESGLLTAKRQGTTYVLADTPSGTAIVKLSVSDGGNLWHDFSQSLGKSIDAVTQEYGPFYAYMTGESLQYIFDDYYVNSMSAFVEAETHLVDSMIVTFNENIESNVVTEYLDSRMVEVKDETQSAAWYVDHPNYLYATYAARWQKEEHRIILTSYDPDWDVREYDFELSLQELKQKYGEPRSFVKDQAMYDVKGEFIESICYFFSNGKVKNYSFYINRRVPKKMVEDYLNSRYKYYSFYDPTVKNVVINGEEKLLKVTYDPIYHTLSFTLKDNHYEYQ